MMHGQKNIKLFNEMLNSVDTQWEMRLIICALLCNLHWSI